MSFIVGYKVACEEDALIEALRHLGFFVEPRSGNQWQKVLRKKGGRRKTNATLLISHSKGGVVTLNVNTVDISKQITEVLENAKIDYTTI